MEWNFLFNIWFLYLPSFWCAFKQQACSLFPPREQGKAHSLSVGSTGRKSNALKLSSFETVSPTRGPYKKQKNLTRTDRQQNIVLCRTVLTRWYPRGIQKLVSTYDLPKLQNCLNLNFRGRGGLSGLKFQRGALWRIWTQILVFEVTVHKPACASQIVSQILRMWRLIRPPTGLKLDDACSFECL